MVRECIELLESRKTYMLKTIGEPQMGKRGLYRKDIMDVIAYCDGKNDAQDFSEITGIPLDEVHGIIQRLLQEDLIEEA